MLRRIILPYVAWFFYRAWVSTWRVLLIEPDSVKKLISEKKPVIFAHWHGDELGIIHLVRHYRIATMTSTSSDGSLVDFVIRKSGGSTSRGSSTRGGVSALKGLVRLVGLGYRASMAVDGPKGPLHKIKPGVFELSRLAHATILPVGVYSKKPILFKKSWSQAQLPRPFAQVIVTFSEPLEIIKKGDDVRSETLTQTLAARLVDARCQAAKLMDQNSTHALNLL